jgi:hypothetical protein
MGHWDLGVNFTKTMLKAFLHAQDEKLFWRTNLANGEQDLAKFQHTNLA